LTVETVWFCGVAFMLTMYVVLDGFDLGAGVIHPFVARTSDERRVTLQAIGPVWDGNEVWLIAAGGALFLSFPRLYAASFSGFYLPLMVVLWLLIVRGLAIELRAHFANPVWTSFWDGLFFVGSSLLAVCFGVAIANVVRGVPLNSEGYFFEPLWTDFTPLGRTPGVLDWYTVLVGALALSALVVHGANFISLRTEDPTHSRARAIAGRWWLLTVVLTILATLATFSLRPGLLGNFAAAPWGGVFPALAMAGLIGVAVFHRRGRDDLSLIASGTYLAGMLASTAFALYPDLLPAVDPVNSLTVTSAAGAPYSLAVGLVWWSIGMILATVYFILLYRLFGGKVRLTEEGY
jgi:cytochrome d ubiquinol oxidase subunit II